MKKKILALLLTMPLIGINQAGWQDAFKGGLDSVMNSGSLGLSDDVSSAAVTALSETEMVDGLKEALASGVESAINNLGKKDGFLANNAVKIPLPSSVEKIGNMARQFGGGSYVDEFETTMNRAAENAVPVGSKIFADAIREMSIDDAQKILKGGDDSATQYFQKVGRDELVTKFKPIVTQATSAAGVTSAYKAMIGQAGPMVSMLGGSDLSDIDGYITNKAVDGLFLMIAAEEKSIRDNPLGSSTDLLKKVFGSLK